MRQTEPDRTSVWSQDRSLQFAPDISAATLPIAIRRREMTAGCGIEHQHRALEPAVTIFAPILCGDISQTEVDERRFAPVMQAAMRVDVLHVVGREISLRETATGVVGHRRHG